MKLTRKQLHWMAASASTAALIFPVWLLFHSGDAGLGPVTYLFSGRAFSDRPLVIGGALDQFSLHKEFFILCYSLVLLCPCMAVVQWINSRSEHRVRLVFAISSLVVLVHPLSILTIFTYDVARYILRMGITPMRLTAMAVAMIMYVAILLFAAWVYGLWRRKPNDTVQPTAARCAVSGG